MANTFIPIASTTVGAGGVAFIEFTSIPQTYTHLMIYHSLRTSRSAYHESMLLTFNGSSASRAMQRGYGAGSGATVIGQDTIMYCGQASGATATAGVFGSTYTLIPHYSNSSYQKSSNDYGVSENNATNAFMHLITNRTTATDAITSIKITPENSGTIQQYSTAYLYGLANT